MAEFDEAVNTLRDILSGDDTPIVNSDDIDNDDPNIVTINVHFYKISLNKIKVEGIRYIMKAICDLYPEREELKKGPNYMDFINPDSLNTIENCIIEPSALRDASSKRFQFEREGYFALDEGASRAGNIIFNRTITLRDSWS